MSKQRFLDQTADKFRMWLWPFAAIVLLILLDRQEQVAVLMYKGIMISVAAWLGYWVDRNLFGELGRLGPGDTNWFVSGAYRRAIIVAAVILGFSLGL